MSRTRPHRPRFRVEPLEARSLMAGGLDSGFGAGLGYASIPIASSSPGDVSIGTPVSTTLALPDGKIILAGTETTNFPAATTGLVLARLDADGSPDPSFGTGGVFQYRPPGVRLSEFTTAAVQADGKVIEVGTAFGDLNNNGEATSTIVAIRVDADGTLDPTYGDAGVARFAFPLDGASTTFAEVESAAIQPDGKLVLGGDVNSYQNIPGRSGAQSAVIRLDDDGSLDRTFGGTGMISAPVTLQGVTDDRTFGLALEPDGRIILAGSAVYGMFSEYPPLVPGEPISNIIDLATTTSAVAIAFNPDGTLATGFGQASNPGILVVPPDPTDPTAAGFAAFRSIVAQPDGKLVMAEVNTSTTAHASGPTVDGLVRLGADGSFDAGFGVGGVATVADQSEVEFGPLSLQADGQIVAAGFVENSEQTDSTGQFLADRFNADGTPDPTFRFAGFSLPDEDLTGTAVAVAAGGDILLAGGTNPEPFGTTASQFVVAAVLAPPPPAPSTIVLEPVPLSLRPPASLDGRGESDLVVYLASSGEFAYRRADGGALMTVPFGVAGAAQTIPALGDYTGLGHSEIAAYLPSQGVYAIRPGDGSPDIVVPFGIPGAGQSIPAPGDYSGSGRDDIAVYMPSIGAFGIRPAGGGPDVIVPFGIPGAGQSLPAPADYFGTGHDDVAVYLASIGAFAIRPPGGGPDVIVPFGVAGVGRSIPVPGDYDNSGHVELAVYLPDLGEFAYRPFFGGPDVVESLGTAGDGSIPVPGDYDGAVPLEAAVYDPNDASFAYRPYGQTADVIQAFGTATLATSLPAAPPGAIAAEIQQATASAAPAASASPAKVQASNLKAPKLAPTHRTLPRAVVAQAIAGASQRPT